MKNILFLIFLFLSCSSTKNDLRQDESSTTKCQNKIWDIPSGNLKFYYELYTWVDEDRDADEVSINLLRKNIMNSKGAISESIERSGVYEEEERTKLQIGKYDNYILRERHFTYDKNGRTKSLKIKSQKNKIPILDFEYSYPDENTIRFDLNDLIIEKRSRKSTYRIEDCKLKSFKSFDLEGNLKFEAEYISESTTNNTFYFSNNKNTKVENIEYLEKDQANNWIEKSIKTDESKSYYQRIYRMIVYQDLKTHFETPEALGKAFASAILNDDYAMVKKNGFVGKLEYTELAINSTSAIFDPYIITSIKKGDNFLHSKLVENLQRFKSRRRRIDWSKVQVYDIVVEKNDLSPFPNNETAEITLKFVDGNQKASYNFYATKLINGWKYIYLK